MKRLITPPTQPVRDEKLAWDGYATYGEWVRAQWIKKPLWKKLHDMFPPYGSGSGQSVCGHMIYGNNPPRWALVLHRIQQWIDNTIYYPLHYRRRRYDIVRTDMGKRYADVDTRMWFACFALLGEFVEKELGRETIDHRHEDCHRGYRMHATGDEKAIDLWLWYLDRRKVNFCPPEEWYENRDWEKITAWENETESKFNELMEIRRSLWT